MIEYICAEKQRDSIFDSIFAILQGGQTLRLSVYFPAHWVSSEKGPTLKGKKSLPFGAISPF